MQIISLIALGLLPLLVIAAAVSDLTTLTIPNWISAALVIGFFPVALLLGLPATQMLTHLGLGFGTLLICMGLFALRVLGGGDAKLMAAAMVWLGASAGLPFVLWTGLVGGAFSLLLLMVRSQVPILAEVGPGFTRRLFRPKGDIPYGVAIAIGALLAFPSSALVALSAAG